MMTGLANFFIDRQKVLGGLLILLAFAIVPLGHAVGGGSQFGSRTFAYLPVRVTGTGGIEIGENGAGTTFSDAGEITVFHTIGNSPGRFGMFLTCDEIQWVYGPGHRPPNPISAAALSTAFDSARGRIADSIGGQPDGQEVAMRLRAGRMRVQSVYWENAIAALFVPLLVVGLGLIAWPSRAERRRWRRSLGQCPNCCYSVKGLPEDVCPECGHPILASPVP